MRTYSLYHLITVNIYNFLRPIEDLIAMNIEKENLNYIGESAFDSEADCGHITRLTESAFDSEADCGHITLQMESAFDSEADCGRITRLTDNALKHQILCNANQNRSDCSQCEETEQKQRLFPM